MAHDKFLSNKELQAFLQSRETLPLQDAFIMAMKPPQKSKNLFGLSSIFPHTPIKPLTMLWLDTAKRPEIRDLARVHTTDGAGTSIFTWNYINEGRPDCYFVLDVSMETPVRTSFRVPIFLNEWTPLIDVVSQTGSVSLLAGPPVNWRELIKTLSPIELEGRIHAQSGGGITLTFDEKMTHELRQHFEQHIEAIARLLGRG